jgi:hypothetical protein
MRKEREKESQNGYRSSIVQNGRKKRKKRAIMLQVRSIQPTEDTREKREGKRERL